MKHKRLLLGTILIIVLFSLMLYYSLGHNNHNPDTPYILDHVEQFNMPHSYSIAAVDPFKASPFSAVTGLFILSSSMNPIYRYDLHEDMKTFLNNKCMNTSFLDTYQLSIIYGDSINTNLTKIHEKVSLYRDYQRRNIKKAFLSLSIGVTTHFNLDFLGVHTHGDIKLLFSLSWDGWQIYVIRSDDYMVTVVAVLAALLVYAIYWYQMKRKKSIQQ